MIDGRYEVRGVLAEGGMGIVYDAVHIELGRRVAIKALARRFAEDTVAVTRFRNEARVAGSLGHPNIVEVFDMGTLGNGAPYLVMERLEGETLGHRMRREKTVGVAESVRLARQMLSALSATHERKIIHRDLKPENVFLAEHPGLPPVIKLLDFGISKNVMPRGDAANLGLTRVGFVMGTPTYMAPEQARGERDLDGRVDLYAVGVLLFEMLVGHPPYQAKSPTALVAEMKRAPDPSPRASRSSVPVALDRAVKRLMALDRTHRFSSASEALAAFSGHDVERPEPGEDEPTVRTVVPYFPDESTQRRVRSDKPRS